MSCGVVIGALTLTGCGSDDGAEETDTEIVSSSQTPEFKEKDVDQKKVKDNLGEPVKDDGLGIEWTLQGVYPDDVSGAVVTVMAKNTNDVPVPPEALDKPKLEIADGNNRFTGIDLIDFTPEQDPSALPPGLDEPLGAGATTNLQYRFDTTAASLWNARLSIGNVVWEGNLNL